MSPEPTLAGDPIPAAQPKRVRKEVVLWKILREAVPEDYARLIGEAIADSGIIADHALTFPLSRSLEKQLVNLPHKHEQASHTTRDQRLVAWFAACVGLGAQPKSAIESMGEHASGGFARLLQMKAIGALTWWREQGVEGHFMGPHPLGGQPTTLATLAFVYGYPGMVDALLPHSQLTHTTQLWRVAWSRRCLDEAKGLLAHLWRVGPPPKDALAGLAQARLNNKNAAQVLGLAQTLADAGCDPTFTPPGTLPALAVAVKNLVSPSSVLLVEFLLQHGADPLEKAVVAVGLMDEAQEMTVVELALSTWLRCPVHSHLQETTRRCVETLMRASDRAALQTLFPRERQEQLIATLRERRVPERPFGQPSPWNADQEVAFLQALWLELDHGTHPVATRRVRL